MSLLLVAALTNCASNPNSKKGKKGAAAVGEAEPQKPEQPRVLPSSVGSKSSYSSVSTNLPFIALTFDDGPHPVNTPKLLDLLKARDIKATFFVVATNADRYPEIMRRIVAEGHEIGNHTVTHGNLAKMSQEEVRSELTRARDSIIKATGVAPRTMRPPYGAITASQKTWIRQEFGYPAILWSVDPEDWKRPGPSVVASRLVSGAKPGGILLVHDIHAPTIEAMPSAIDQILRKGLQFVTVTQLIAMDQNG